MTREYIASANTVEEAFELACQELGVAPDEISSREVLKLPKKGLFGKIKQQAQVKVTVEDEEPVKPAAPVAPAAPAAPVKAETPAPEKAPAPAAKKPAAPKAAEKPAPKKEPAKVAAPAAPAAPEKPAAPAPAAPAAPAAPVAPAETAAPAEPQLSEEELEDIEPKIEIARAYLSEIFEKMGAGDVTMEFTKAEDRTVIIHLNGDSIGSVIGKRGETLDSLQYLVCLVANRLRRREGDYVRFTMNAGNYREKREETLRALAARMAKKALKTGRPVALEPMNPYERRIIHAVITDIEGVTSKSTGEEPNRKVIIKPTRTEGAERDRSRGRGGRSRRDGDRRGPRRERSDRGERTERAERPARPEGEEGAAPRETAPKEPVRREAKKLDDDFKLYGKIEL